MSRLIVVSNRVSPSGAHGEASQGGLASAISAALREYRGIWFGWSGQTTETFTGKIAMQRREGVTVATTDLEEQDVQEYYNGYANRTLWPLFHYRMELTAFERTYSVGYLRVNGRFSETLSPLIEPDDLVWVQDYHLIPLARELRVKGIRNEIGFFLHIPWPVRALMVTLPNHRELVEALFSYDMIGFHTEEWREAFENYVILEAGGVRTPDGRLTAFGRTIRVGAFPIGIDVDAFRNLRESEVARDRYAQIQESKSGRQMILGVDRLDYSKGLEEKFSAYERLLSKNDDLRRQVFMLQISTFSRGEVPEYQEIAARLDALSGRINGAMSEMDWIPIRNVHRMHSREELAGIYRAANVGFVSPLRDGMNLVAKEFVASQDEDDPGVLVLSRFAGAAAQMREALIVNPFAQEDVADALRRALEMPRKERVQRWRALMVGIQRDDITAWRDSFVESLKSARTPLTLKSRDESPAQTQFKPAKLAPGF